MKKSIYLICTLSMLLFSCSNDEDPRGEYPKNIDAKFEVQSSHVSRLSLIETSISNGVDQNGTGDIDITTSSYSRNHLPFKKEYIHQTLKYNTNLLLTFTDNSGVPLDTPFESYNIILTILVDGEIMVTKELLVDEAGFVGYVAYDLL